MPEALLKRYSKPRGAGDQTSGGRGKLLRAHGELTRVQILVRETIQNSWDAAEDDWYPAYGARVRRAGAELTSVLRRQVFTGLGPELAALRESLQDDGLHVLEVFDRGTSGLDGPINPDEAAPEREPNNFNAFVFDIGSTKPSGKAGGTFGFGKTATFEVSRPHAVVYWTCCDRGDGVLEHRLIASALHEPYDIDGKRYTGAHWWGDQNSAEIVPLCGDAAQELGEKLFTTHFGDEETGTSILVIEPMVTMPTPDGVGDRVPVRGRDEADALSKQIIEAVVTSAWPKLVPYADGDAPMIFEFDVYGDAIDVSAVVEERYRVLGHGLSQIRAAQKGEKFGAAWPKPENILEERLIPINLRPTFTEDHPRREYFGDRDDQTAGHLYLAKVLSDPFLDTTVAGGHNRYCFMRSEAELVVSYETLAEDDGSPFNWYAVFKPTPECDVHFAASEPSTHDAWNKNAPESAASTYVVEKAINAVRARARSFMSTKPVVAYDEERSARQLARSLNGFMPTGAPASPDLAPEPAEGAGGGGGTGGSRKKKVRAGVDLKDSRRDDDGAWAIDFSTFGPEGARLDLRAVASALSSDGGMQLDDDEISVSWTTSGAVIQGWETTVEAGEPGVLTLRPSIEATISCEIRVKAVSS